MEILNNQQKRRRLIWGGLFAALPLCLLLWSCSSGEMDNRQEVGTIEVVRTGGVTVDPESDDLAEIMEGLVVSDSLGIAYGVDLRVMKAYQLDLEIGEVNYLAPEGRGPEELNIPVQITKKAENNFLIYDNGLDVIAEHRNGAIQQKVPGFLEHGVWVRNFNGFYHDGSIITGIVDPEKVRSLDFENAKPLAFLDYKSGEMVKKGEFSPTVDHLDSDNKYPVVYFDEDLNTVFYLFRNDYTVMAYNLDEDTTTALDSYRPTKFRTKTIAVQGSTAGNRDAAMALGLDITIALGIDRVGDHLIVVWNNYNEGFYEEMGDFTPGNVDYFGVMYDLPGFSNPREFTLPGKFLGTYRNKLLVEEELGGMDLKMGFYEFVF